MVLTDRSVSECSDDINIRPLELDDLRRGLDERSEEIHSSIKRSDESQHQYSGENSIRFFSAVFGMGLKRAREKPTKNKSLAKMHWKNAVLKVRAMGDPWEKFHLDTYKTEKARRHRYHALSQRWFIDEVLVKMEPQPFNNGAMRQCFRMKKLSNFSQQDDWARAHNYVAKNYMDESTPRSTYFEDVKLQMDAKLWGEEFNRHNPPKKVDIFQMSILEMYEREGRPLFHLEHFIEGKYVKYNSNSGFVRSEALRMTPQAFSHFTFERSGHELIVVDIQGVGDLYTDPQIHTSKGDDYGDGNLGTRGMALFLHSHRCNTICKSLNLTPFDLAPSEVQENEHKLNLESCKTVARGTEEIVITPTEEEKEHIHEYIRMRSLSQGYGSGDERPRIKLNSISSVESFESDDLHFMSESEDSAVDSARRERPGPGARPRFDSTCDSGPDTSVREKEMLQFKQMVMKKSRPSHVLGEMEHRKLVEALEENHSKTGGSILGQIHLDLAKYHELSRFVEESEMYDQEAAIFHVEQAAKCGILEAIKTMANLHLGLQHDILPDIELDDNRCDIETGFNYLLIAAEAKDRAAMINVAKSFETGVGLPPSKEQNWERAVYWLEKVVNTTTEDEEGEYNGSMDDPLHQLVAKEAMMYWSGGHSLTKDPNKAGELFTWAAELATEAMKGKLASKYYMQAEEAWAECDVEE